MRRGHLVFWLIGGLLGAPGALQADVLATGAVGDWHYDPRGLVRYRGESLDVDEYTARAPAAGTRNWLTLEHSLRLVPNLRLNHTRSLLSARMPRGADSLSETGAPGTHPLSADAALDQYDATFYYQFTDDLVSLDLGFNVRYLDGSYTTWGGGARESRDFSAYVPMFYAKALFGLPFQGLSAGFEGSTSQYEDSKVLDYEAKLAYEWSAGFGLEGGWRHQQLRLDESDELNPDLKHRGPFIDFRWRF